MVGLCESDNETLRGLAGNLTSSGTICTLSGRILFHGDLHSAVN